MRPTLRPMFATTRDAKTTPFGTPAAAISPHLNLRRGGRTRTCIPLRVGVFHVVLNEHSSQRDRRESNPPQTVDSGPASPDAYDPNTPLWGQRLVGESNPFRPGDNRLVLQARHEAGTATKDAETFGTGALPTELPEPLRAPGGARTHDHLFDVVLAAFAVVPPLGVEPSIHL